MNPENRKCQNCKADFIIEPEDFKFYEKIKVPPPTWCPECRMIRRMAFRDYRVLYKRKSDATGETIFSVFHQNSPFKIWERDLWWTDKMEGLDYGMDIDFDKSFFEQLKELFFNVPLPSQTAWDFVNSDYCTGSNGLKNCYLVMIATHCEDCMYCAEINNTKGSIDITRSDSCESCYQSFALIKCFRTFFSSHCENCMDVWFSRNLMGCNYCLGCANLRNKQYYIFNKPYSKEEYFKIVKEFNLGTHTGLKKIEEQARELANRSIRKYYEGRHNTSVSGEYINNSKNSHFCYYLNQGEDCKYVQLFLTPNAKDCYDCTMWGENTELSYECSSVGANCYNVKFSSRTYKNSQNCEYSLFCVGCSNCFGCVGLKLKKYCILNKQYSREEYEKLVPKIKEQMMKISYIDQKGIVYRYGDFFPTEFCPFAYNESLAQDYFPLTKEKAIELGFSWKDKNERKYEIDIRAEELPDHIEEVDDTIIGKAIQCEHNEDNNHKNRGCVFSCTDAFKITKSELGFYKNMNLPLPRLCHNCRHFERLEMRNSIKLWHRKCMHKGCTNEFETSYAPDRPEIIYCESCYNKEVY